MSLPTQYKLTKVVTNTSGQLNIANKILNEYLNEALPEAQQTQCICFLFVMFPICHVKKYWIPIHDRCG